MGKEKSRDRDCSSGTEPGEDVSSSEKSDSDSVGRK